MASIGGAAISLNRQFPVIDYTSLDFVAIKADLTKYAQATYSDRWTDFNADQFAVVFLDLVAYSGDLLTYYFNSSLREVTVQNVQRRQHMIELATTLDYVLSSASQASGPLQILFKGSDLPFVLSQHTQFAAGSVYFQPDQDYPLSTGVAISGPDAQGNYTFSINVEEGREFQSVLLGNSDGTREQSFQLPQSPLIDGTLTVLVNGIAWSVANNQNAFVQSFSVYGPTDQVYRVETDDNDVTTIFFGDSVNGLIPPLGQAITATWKTGGGTQGNVGPNTITTAVTSVAGIVSITNPSMLTGGNAKQTLNSARAAIPLSLAAGDRAVNLPDYATVAKAASGSVAKAVALESASKIVDIAIAPSGGGFASLTLKGQVSAYVDARRMIGRRARIIDPTYVNCEVNVDLFVDPSVNRSNIVQIAQALFITTDPTAQQVGMFDFPNVGFGARDDNGDPQLTSQRVYDLLGTLANRGVQSAVLNTFDSLPAIRPVGIPAGNGTFALTTTNALLRVRRQWRVVFTDATHYAVFERIVGESTSLTSTLLTDDRQTFPALAPVAGGTVLNPNINQSQTFPVTSWPAVTQVQVTGDLLSAASKGNSYYIEWPATPSTGVVGTPYSPTNALAAGISHGFSWLFTAGGTPWNASDTYTIMVFEAVDSLILAADEIPQLQVANLTINAKSAV